MPDLDAITDALAAAQKRGLLPTALSTKELRELGADVLARSVFSARATNAIFADELKKIIDRLAAGDIGEGQARTAIWEILDILGYYAEKGGFPAEELEPAVKGTLQDLMSFRRRDLIVRTQRDLMQGAGLKMRGSEPDRLSEFPAWELVRNLDVTVPRNWNGESPSKKDPRSRWVIAGGTLVDGGRMVALKGDPIWGEIGSYENFSDALGVDHPPFAFNSGMGWREISAEEAAQLAISGPDGETVEEWLASEPATLTGKQPLPTPQVSLNGVDPAIIERFRKATKAETGGKPYVFTYSDILEKELKTADEAYQKGAATR
ncbi:MAG: hypothetical protein MUC40_00065 [Akkermansiaceae bacterium]|jgi:hypothetical protein|nr:hypothetical protein [Akkermansiaceae bacterium]